jgi:hypothetical protein
MKGAEKEFKVELFPTRDGNRLILAEFEQDWGKVIRAKDARQSAVQTHGIDRGANTHSINTEGISLRNI